MHSVITGTQHLHPLTLEQGFPKDESCRGHHGITTTMARRWVAACRAKGSMLTASFLLWDNVALAAGRHFFSPATLHGSEGAVRRPFHELLCCSNPNWGFGAFPLKTTFVVRTYNKALSKKFHLTAASLHWHRCPQAGSNPSCWGEALIQQYQRTTWLCVSQSHKESTAPGNIGEQ